MNIYGYKQKHKIMARLLKREYSKDRDERCEEKIDRLEKSKKDCAKRIRILQDARKKSKDKIVK